MANNEHPIPSPGEIAASKRRLDDFYERVRAVPEHDRVLLTSDKFAAPIGLNDDGTPQSPARVSDESNRGDGSEPRPGGTK